MNVESFVIMDVLVSLLWLHAIYFDEIQQLPTLWSRWLPVTETAVRLRPLFRVVAKAVAVLASAVYAAMLLAYVMG